MKIKLILALAIAMISFESQAQTERKDWYNNSFEKDGIYGAEIDKALEFLGQRKSNYRPTVAIIGAGIDVEHEALAKNIWQNKNEKADGIDNDNNGLVDDINGWNFIGQKDGSTMSNIGSVADREWFRLKDKYDFLFDGKTYFRYKDGKRIPLTTPVDHAEYCYFKSLNMLSDLASQKSSCLFGHCKREYAIELFKDLHAKYPNRKLVYEDMATLYDIKERSTRDSLFRMSYAFIGMHAQMARQNVDSTYDYMAFVENNNVEQASLDKAWARFEATLAKYPVGVREKMVGDDPENINDKKYGNNVLFTSNSTGGTMISTIIGGERGVEGRNNPICENAQIMPLIVVDQFGEPYLKDVALAVRYAVDNGADIICFTIPNKIYPVAQKGWVEDAMRYAEKKGVLIVINSYEASENMDQVDYFPNRFMTAGKEFTNVMIVAPSDVKGNPMLKSNFGAKQVDLYAPGDAILAGYVGDTYKVGSGAILSMAVTAGVAALVKSYYPNLTGSQIRTLLNESVTSREGVEVEKMVKKQQIVQDMYLFDELCLSKGIINAYKAVQAAEKLNK